MNTTVGVERERFIVDRSSGKIVPAIGKLLPKVHETGRQRGLPTSLFGYELFAGQIEDRTPPCKSLVELRSALAVNDAVMEEVAIQNGLVFDSSDFVEECQIMSLEVNPFDQRHHDIWRAITQERRSAASRVAATHIHVAVTKEQAVALINACREKEVERLIKTSDHSNGRRINTYRIMAETKGVPPIFSSFEELMAYIERHGGEKNVWDLVRFKPSTQTVEFRMFGATNDIDEVVEYAKLCIEMLNSIKAR